MAQPHNQPTPQPTYIDELKEEALHLSGEEREIHEALVAQLVGELALEVAVQERAMQDIERAKQMATAQAQSQVKAGSGEKNEIYNAPVDFDAIGWINEEGTRQVKAEKVTSKGLEYLFIDLTSESNPTRKLREKLEVQTDASGDIVLAKLMPIVKETVIPELHEGIMHGQRIRPVSIGGRNAKDVPVDKSLNTTYPGYKEGVHGPQNRIILLKLEEKDSLPVYAMAAIYDHEDDRIAHNAMFLKQK